VLDCLNNEGDNFVLIVQRVEWRQHECT
jgi:hypothetical protein